MKIAFLLTLLTLAACSKVPDTTCFSRRNCSLVRSSGSTTRRYLSETYADDITERFLHLELLSSAVVNPIKNEKCRTHLVNFIDGLRNSSSWAVEMFDASSKFPTGLVTANTYQFGNYDQCVNVNPPDVTLKGKYCLVNIQFAPRRNKYSAFYEGKSEKEFSLEYDEYKSVLDKFKVTKDVTKQKRNNFYTGLCLPDACSSEDAKVLLSSMLIPTARKFGYNVSVAVPERFCSTNEVQQLSREGKILGSFILGVVFFVFFCTVWDRIKLSRRKPRSKIQLYVKAFSLFHNISQFSAQNSNGDMNIFNGMKCLSMILVILGHRSLASFGGPFFNPQFLEERYRKIQNVFLLNGTLIVDTFFLIGGYLTFLTLFKECKMKRTPGFLQIYAYRWLRIAPVYLLVIFFYAHFLEHLGTGPVWKMRVGREAERCRKNWWTNFLFINNYINTDSLCMFQSWYVTCDMHFTFLAPIIVRVIVKSQRKGLLLLTALILSSVVATFLVTYYNKYDGVLRVYISTFEDVASSFTFNQVYIKTHHRATPYFSGMAAAYLYLKLKQIQYKFSLKAVWLYSTLAAICALSSICGAWVFYIPGRRYNAFENALYASSHRLLWALGMSWVAVAGGTKAFGMLEPFLSKGIFTPFSKLSYSTFLVHGAIQLYTSSTLRVPEYMSFSKLYWMTCGDVILSFGFAFLIHIFFEAPLKGIQRILFTRKPVNRRKILTKHTYVQVQIRLETENEITWNGGTRIVTSIIIPPVQKKVNLYVQDGDQCIFRHEPSALGCETVCPYWQQRKCDNLFCNLRHMELKKNRKTIPCYWETQPGGCRKPHCPFLHVNPREQQHQPIVDMEKKECEQQVSATQPPLDRGDWPRGGFEHNEGHIQLASDGDAARLGPRHVNQGSLPPGPVPDPLVVSFDDGMRYY
ncbi:hypothetical protein RUM44_008006 [Polyplax serrata]|uniref:C3H1-type domain-containing protein n=1 Tax=Polyplax serrata TaxID=468196 RepID=A0ABR1B8X7_POLSC